MNYTLDICGDETIQNPTASDIRQAVFALEAENGEAFLVLEQTDMTYIQTSGDLNLGDWEFYFFEKM